MGHSLGGAMALFALPKLGEANSKRPTKQKLPKCDARTADIEPLPKQIWDVVTEIGDDIWHGIFESFANAHSRLCGQGYMREPARVCPPTA